jgi:hypothetical protein
MRLSSTIIACTLLWTSPDNCVSASGVPVISRLV